MAVKNYLDKTGTLYEWIKIQGYLSSNYATQSMLTSLANSESALNSTQNSQLSSLSTENSTQNSEMASMSASLSEQASQIAILSTSSSEAGSDITSELSSLSTENAAQSSELSSLSTSLSEVESNIASLSTAQSTVDSTQNVAIASLSTQNSTQTSEISSLTTATSEFGEDLDDIESEVATKQPMLTAGDNIAIDSNNVISVTGAVDIDDTVTSSSTTWSSSKINTQIQNKTEINDSAETLSNTWSASKIRESLAALNSLTFAVVQALPTTDISTRTIYLVPKSTAQTSNTYDEYMYINNQWELIGSTDMDLSGYVLESDLVPISNEEIDAMFE